MGSLTCRGASGVALTTVRMPLPRAAHARPARALLVTPRSMYCARARTRNPTLALSRSALTPEALTQGATLPSTGRAPHFQAQGQPQEPCWGPVQAPHASPSGVPPRIHRPWGAARAAPPGERASCPNAPRMARTCRGATQTQEPRIARDATEHWAHRRDKAAV